MGRVKFKIWLFLISKLDLLLLGDEKLYFTRVSKDTNHYEIIAEFKKHGAVVDDLAHVGGGFPDLIVNLNGFTFFVEVKYEKGRFTKLQKIWFALHNNCLAFVVRNTIDVQEMCEIFNNAGTRTSPEVILKKLQKFVPRSIKKWEKTFN